MALDPSSNATMTGRITAPDAAFPYGSSKDETAPGNNDGTPYFKARADDIFGFFQSLLNRGGVVPNGNPDSVSNPQYLEALDNINAAKFSLGLNWKDGLEVSNNGADPDNDLDIAAGSIMDSTNTVRMNLLAPETRQIDQPFSEAGPGGFSDASTLLAQGAYRPYLIAKADGTAHVIIASNEADALADTVANAAGYIYARRISRVTRFGGVNWRWYKVVNGRYFYNEEVIISLAQSNNDGAVISAIFPALGFDLQATYEFRVTIESQAGTARLKVAATPPGPVSNDEADAVARLDEFNSNTVNLGPLFFVRASNSTGLLTTQHDIAIGLTTFQDDITIL